MKTVETKEIEIVINGERRRVPSPSNVRELLNFLDLVPDQVAVEIDGAIVGKQYWPSTALAAGSELEIVQFVGGG